MKALPRSPLFCHRGSCCQMIKRKSIMAINGKLHIGGINRLMFALWLIYVLHMHVLAFICHEAQRTVALCEKHIDENTSSIELFVLP